MAVIDISARAASDPDAEVEVRDLRRFERRYGRIPYGAIVCMYSGWEARLPDPVAFKNADADGTYHFPDSGSTPSNGCSSVATSPASASTR